MGSVRADTIGAPSGPSSGPALPAPSDPPYIVGLPPDPSTGNCFPLGCAYSGTYQQVYSSSAFSSPITITGLEFFNTRFNSSATAMNSGTWTIDLSTTSANWNTLSSTFASNIGAGDKTVFNGNLSQSWAFGDTLAINFMTPFLYNPADGNLLMDVNVSGATQPGGPIFFDTNGFNNGGFDGNTIMGRVFCGSCGGATTGFVNSGYGLVTGFNSSVPEPSSVVLLVAVVARVGAKLRQASRRTAV